MFLRKSWKSGYFIWNLLCSGVKNIKGWLNCPIFFLDLCNYKLNLSCCFFRPWNSIIKNPLLLVLCSWVVGQLSRVFIEKPQLTLTFVKELLFDPIIVRKRCDDSYCRFAVTMIYHFWRHLLMMWINVFFWATKGQLISKCPFGVIVWTKIPTKKFPGFLP